MFRKVSICLYCKSDRSSSISLEVWLQKSHWMWVTALSLSLNDTYSKSKQKLSEILLCKQNICFFRHLEGRRVFSFPMTPLMMVFFIFCLLGKKKKKVKEILEGTAWKLELKSCSVTVICLFRQDVYAALHSSFLLSSPYLVYLCFLYQDREW